MGDVFRIIDRFKLTGRGTIYHKEVEQSFFFEFR